MIPRVDKSVLDQQRANLPQGTSLVDYIAEQAPKQNPDKYGYLPSYNSFQPPAQPTVQGGGVTEDIFTPKNSTIPAVNKPTYYGNLSNQTTDNSKTLFRLPGELNDVNEPWNEVTGEVSLQNLKDAWQVAKNYPKGLAKAVNDINSLPQTAMAGAEVASSNQAKQMALQARNEAMSAEASGNPELAKMYNDLAAQYEAAGKKDIQQAQTWANKAADKPGILESNTSGRTLTELERDRANNAINYIQTTGIPTYEGMDLNYWMAVKNNAESTLTAMDSGAAESAGQQLMNWAAEVDAENKSLSQTGQFFAGLSESMGRMSVTHGVGKVAAALGFAAQAENIGLAAMGLSVYNNELKQSTLQGYDVETATTKAVISAGTEVATELLVGGLPGFKATDPVTGEVFEKEGLINKVISKLSQKALANAEARGVTQGGIKALGEIGAGFLRWVDSPVGKVITDIYGEGMEEVVADIANPVLNRLFNPGADEEDKRVQYGNGELLMSWLGGAISSAFFQTTSNLGQLLSSKQYDLSQVAITPTREELEQAVRDYQAEYRQSTLTKASRTTYTSAVPNITAEDFTLKTPEQVQATVQKHIENVERIETGADAEALANATEDQKSVYEAVKLVNYAMLGGLNTMSEEGKAQYTGMLSKLKTKLAVDFLPDELLTWTPNMVMEDVENYVKNVVLPAYQWQNSVNLGPKIVNMQFNVADLPPQALDGTIKFKPADVNKAKAATLKAGGKKLTATQLNSTGVNDTKLTPEQRLAAIKEYIDPESLFVRLYIENPDNAASIYGKDLVTAYENKVNHENFPLYGALRVGNNYMSFNEFYKSRLEEKMGAPFESLSDRKKAQAVSLFREAQLESTPKDYITKVEEQLNNLGMTVEWLSEDYVNKHPGKYGDVSTEGVLRLNPYRINSRGGAAYIVAHEILGHVSQYAAEDANLNMTDAVKGICEAIGADYDKEFESTKKRYPNLSEERLEGEVNATVLGKMLASDKLLDYFASINNDDARELQKFLDTLVDPTATDAFTRQIRGIYATIAQSIDGTLAQHEEERQVLRNGPEAEVEETVVETTEEKPEEAPEEVIEEETIAPSKNEEVEVVEETEEEEEEEPIKEESVVVETTKTPKTYVATDPITINLPSSDPLSALNGWSMSLVTTRNTLKLQKAHIGQPLTSEEEAALNLLGAKGTRRGKHVANVKYWDDLNRTTKTIPDLAADGSYKSTSYNRYGYRIHGMTQVGIAWQKLGGPAFSSAEYIRLLHTHTNDSDSKGMLSKRQREIQEVRDRMVEDMLAENMNYRITDKVIEAWFPTGEKTVDPKTGKIVDVKEQANLFLKPLKDSVIRVNANIDRNGKTYHNVSIEPAGDAFTGDALKAIRYLGFKYDQQVDASTRYLGRQKTVYYLSEADNPGLVAAIRARNWGALFKGAVEAAEATKAMKFPKPGVGFMFDYGAPGKNGVQLGLMFVPSTKALRGELGVYNPDGMNAEDKEWGRVVGFLTKGKNAKGLPTEMETPSFYTYTKVFQRNGFDKQEMPGLWSKLVNFEEFRNMTGTNVDVNEMIAAYKRANPDALKAAITEPERVFVMGPSWRNTRGGLDLATRDPKTGVIFYDTGEELEFYSRYMDPVTKEWKTYLYTSQDRVKADKALRSRDIPINTTLRVTYKDGHVETVKNEALSGDEFYSPTINERNTIDELEDDPNVLRIESVEFLSLGEQNGVPSAAILYDATDPERSSFDEHATRDWVYKGNNAILVSRTNDNVAPEKIILPQKVKYGELLKLFGDLISDKSVKLITGADNNEVLYDNTTPEKRKRSLQGFKAALDPTTLSWRSRGKELRIKFFGDPVYYPYGSRTAFDYGITDQNGAVTQWDTSVEKIVLKGDKKGIIDNTLAIEQDGKVVGKQTFPQWLAAQIQAASSEEEIAKYQQEYANKKRGAKSYEEWLVANKITEKFREENRKEFNKLVEKQQAADEIIYEYSPDGGANYNNVIATVYPELSGLYVEFDAPEYKDPKTGKPIKIAWTTGIFDDYIKRNQYGSESKFRGVVAKRLDTAIKALNTMRILKENGQMEPDAKYSPDPAVYEPRTEERWRSDVKDYQGALASMGGGYVTLDRKIISLSRADGTRVYERSMWDPENPEQSFGSTWYDTDVAALITRLVGLDPEISEYIPLAHIPYDKALTDEKAKENAYKYEIGFKGASGSEAEAEDVVGEEDPAVVSARMANTAFAKYLKLDTTPNIDNNRDDAEVAKVQEPVAADEPVISEKIEKKGGVLADYAYAAAARDRAEGTEEGTRLADEIVAEGVKEQEAQTQKRENRREKAARQMALILDTMKRYSSLKAVDCSQAPELNSLKSYIDYTSKEIQLTVQAMGEKFIPVEAATQRFLGHYQFYLKEIPAGKAGSMIVYASKFTPGAANALGMGYVDIENNNSQSLYDNVEDVDLYKGAKDGAITLYDTSGKKKVKLDFSKIKKAETAYKKIAEVRAKGALKIVDNGSAVTSYNIYANNPEAIKRFRAAMGNKYKGYSDVALSKIMDELADMQRAKPETYSEDAQKFRDDLAEAKAKAEASLGRELDDDELGEISSQLSQKYTVERLNKLSEKDKKYLALQKEESRRRFFEKDLYTNNPDDLRGARILNKDSRWERIKNETLDADTILEGIKLFADSEEMRSAPLYEQNAFLKKVGEKYIKRAKQLESDKADRLANAEAITAKRRGVNLKDTSDKGIAAFAEAFPEIAEGLTKAQIKKAMAERAAEQERQQATEEAFAQKKLETTIASEVSAAIDAALYKVSPEYKAKENLKALEQHYMDTFRQLRSSEAIARGIKNSTNLSADKVAALVESSKDSRASGLLREDQQKLDALLKGRDSAFYKNVKDANRLNDSDQERYRFLRFHDMPDSVAGFVSMAEEWLTHIGYYDLPAVYAKQVSAFRDTLKKSYDKLVAERVQSNGKLSKREADARKNIRALIGEGVPFYAQSFTENANDYYRFTDYKDDPQSVYVFLKNKKAPRDLAGFEQLAKEYLEYIGYTKSGPSATTEDRRAYYLEKLYDDKIAGAETHEQVAEAKRIEEMLNNAPIEFLDNHSSNLYDPETYEEYADEFYKKNREFDAQGRPLSRQQSEFFKDKAGARDRGHRLIPLTPSDIAQPIPQNISFGDLKVYVPAIEGSGEMGYASMKSPLVIGGPNASMVPAGIQKGRNAVLDVILKRQPNIEKSLYLTLLNTGRNAGVKNLQGMLLGGNQIAAEVLDGVAKAFGGETAAEQAEFKKQMLMELGYDGVQIWNSGTRAYDTVLLLNDDQFINVDDTNPSAPQDYLDELDLQELLDSVSEFSGTTAEEHPETVKSAESDKLVFNQSTQALLNAHAPTESTYQYIKDLVAEGKYGYHYRQSNKDVIQTAENWIQIHGGVDKAFQDFVNLVEEDRLISLKAKNAASSTALAWLLAYDCAEGAETDTEHREQYAKMAAYCSDVYDQLDTLYGQGLQASKEVRNIMPKMALSTHQGVLGNMQRWLKGINNEYRTNIQMTEEQKTALTKWKDDDQKLAAIDAFGTYVAQQLPKGFENSKYFDELRKAMMLSAPRTGVVNFASNVANKGLDSAKNIVAGAISDALLTGDEKAYRSLKNMTRMTADPRIAEDWDNMEEWAPTIYEANHDHIVNTGNKWWDKSGSTSRVQKAFEAEKDIFYFKLPEWIGNIFLADAGKSLVKNTSKHQSDWFENTDDTGLVDFIASALPDKFLGKDATGLKEKIRNSKIPNLAGLKATWLPAFKNYLRSQGYTTEDLEKANHLREARMALKAEHDPTKVEAAKARVKECEDAAKVISDAIDFATKEAQSVTYRAKNDLAQMVNALKKRSSTTDDPAQRAVLWFLEKALDSEMPFTTVLFNMVDTAIKYDPVVAAGITAYQYKNSKGKDAKYNINDVIDSAAKGIVGFGLEALGWLLAAAGKLRGTGDTDEKRIEDFYTNVGGNADYAWITDEGDSYTLDWMGPVAMRVFRGVALYEFFAKLAASKGTDVDMTPADGFLAAFSVLGSGMGPIAEMSFMTSINSFVKAIAREDTPGDMLVAALKHPAQNYVMQAIPAVSGRIANVIDPTVRSTYAPAGAGKQLEQTGRQIANKIPFLKQAVNSPKYDYFGNEMTNAVFDTSNPLGVLGNAAYTLLSPGYVNKNNIPEDVGNMLDEVFATSKDKNIYPTEAPKSFTVNGTKYVMTNQEFSDMSLRAGDYTKRIYEMAANNYAFDNYLSPEQQADALTSLQTVAKTMAKSDYCYLNGIKDYSGDDTLKKIIELQELGIDVVTYYAAKQLIKGISGKGAADKKRKILRQYGFDTRQIEALI